MKVNISIKSVFNDADPMMYCAKKGQNYVVNVQNKVIYAKEILICITESANISSIFRNVPCQINLEGEKVV